MIFQLAPISSRNEFGKLLNARFMNDAAAEIGTHRGEFALAFLNGWHKGTLWCVDHYPAGYDAGDPASGGDREADAAEAKAVLKKHAGRVRSVREPSPEASARFKDVSLDFVYVDGKHRTADVVRDLRAWWPKVRPGGILAGHDIICPGEVGGGWGPFVQTAVRRFSRDVGLDVFLVVEENGLPWSYYFEKPK